MRLKIIYIYSKHFKLTLETFYSSLVELVLTQPIDYFMGKRVF